MTMTMTMYLNLYDYMYDLAKMDIHDTSWLVFANGWLAAAGTRLLSAEMSLLWTEMIDQSMGHDVSGVVHSNSKKNTFFRVQKSEV